jgi:hypothetical protein
LLHKEDTMLNYGGGKLDNEASSIEYFLTMPTSLLHRMGPKSLDKTAFKSEILCQATYGPPCIVLFDAPFDRNTLVYVPDDDVPGFDMCTIGS